MGSSGVPNELLRRVACERLRAGMEHVQRARGDAGGDDRPHGATDSELWRRAVAATATKHVTLRRRRWDAYRPERDDDPQVRRTPRASASPGPAFLSAMP